MKETRKGRTARGSYSSRFLAGFAIAATIAAVNLPHAALSQISSKVSNTPFSEPQKESTPAPVIPKAPVQVELPAPPPMKIFPGLAEPLVATGPVTDAESKDLDAALKEFHETPLKVGAMGDYDDFNKPLLAFIAAHPQSNWNATLQLDIALGYYHDGYYSRALTAFEQAWKLGRNATSPQAHIIIDRAVGELAKFHARVGHGPELVALFADIGTRPIGGPGTGLIESARAGLSAFQKNVGISYLCGPKALKAVLMTLKASNKQIKVADDALSGPDGFSLEQLAQLATKAGLKYRLIHREPGQPIPVPSIVNWNVHHYAALTGMRDGRYEVYDITFGSDGGARFLTTKAVDAESSGYFLVPASVAAKYPNNGWRSVGLHSAEAKAAYGKGSAPMPWPGEGGDCPYCPNKDADQGVSMTTPNNSPQTTTPWLPGQGIPVSNALPQPGKGMAVASTAPTDASLQIQDTPVGYAPQIGGINLDTITYTSREDLQPAILTYSNLSAKWSHAWMSVIQYDPTGGAGVLQRSASGGGGAYYLTYYNHPTGSYEPQTQDNSILTRTPASGVPTSYTRNLPDGAKETYSLSNGATSYPALMFLTSVTDAKGNTTTLNYDGTFRLTSVVDAMGRSTTFTYGLTAYPLLITKITDPFGRTAQITYDTSERLSTITDPVGITSTFTYSPTETTFVNSLVTPYGTSTFSDGVNPNDFPASGTTSLSLTKTDPLGYTDYFYFYQQSQTPLVTPASDPTSTLPTGVPGVVNNLLEYRNTYHWNKHAWGACVTAGGCTITSGVPQSEDFTKAELTHWFHAATATRQTLDLSREISSIKKPLENRVWFNYEDEASGYWSGVLDKPTNYGRVLDDGTTQLRSASFPQLSGEVVYTSSWPLLQVDPMGRELKNTYATNGIDLLTIGQKTSASAYTTTDTYGSYNTQHEPQTYTGADGQTWHYTYNTVGQIKTVTDPNSGVTTYNYDTTGRLSTIQNANLVTALTLTYDSADRVLTRTDSEGYTLTYAYDNLDRVTKITYPDATTDLYDYTFQSGPYVGTESLELRKHTDRLGRVTTYGYDADQRLTSVTEPTSGSSTRTTNYDYYEDGTLKDIIDANGNDTHWDIDIESRPVDKVYQYGTASATTETYAYENTISRLHSITDALGQVKTFIYAKDNRITGISYTSSINTTPNVTFAYDTYWPRMTSMVDGTGTTTYSYTPVGTLGALKLSSIAGPYTNDTVGLTYDDMGRLAGRTVTGGNETFGYDAISRMNSHVTPLGSFTEGYLGETNQQTSQSVTNGTVTVSTGWSYDTNANDRRLIGIANSGVSRSYTLGYGSGPVNVYDIMSISDTAATGHPWATQSRGYTYDNIDRLLTASSTTPGNDTYAYDKVDNATTYNIPGTSTSPTYNGFNQIKTWGSNTYVYDNDGNLTSGDGAKTYKYDAENRLIEIDYVGTSSKSVFTYDGVGHRISDAETVSGTTTTTYYEWCGSFICQTRNSSQTAIRRDLPEGEYNVSTSQKLVYMPDQLGSVRDVLDATTGTRVASYDFTPNGAVARSSVTNGTDYQYAQLFNHPQSTLNLATFRTLDGNTGRWTNRDPIRERAGFNLYAYSKEKITNRVDPLGWDEFDPLCYKGGIDCTPGPSNYPYTENQPGIVVNVTACLGGCVSATVNPFNTYGGLGWGWPGFSCSVSLTNNMQAYSSGVTYSGGFGNGAGGANSESIGLGFQFPAGFGFAKTTSEPISISNFPPPYPKASW